MSTDKKPTIIEAVNVTRCPPGWAKLLSEAPWETLRPGWRVKTVAISAHTTLQQKQTFCMDCLGSEPEPYMIHNDLWKQAVPTRKGILCVRCLEKRLGRKVAVDDLTEARINGVARYIAGQEASVTGPRRKDQ